jgi:hypothetical protein
LLDFDGSSDPSRGGGRDKTRNKDFEFDGSKAGNILLPHPLPCMRGGSSRIHTQPPPLWRWEKKKQKGGGKLIEGEIERTKKNNWIIIFYLKLFINGL